MSKSTVKELFAIVCFLAIFCWSLFAFKEWAEKAQLKMLLEGKSKMGWDVVPPSINIEDRRYARTGGCAAFFGKCFPDHGNVMEK